MTHQQTVAIANPCELAEQCFHERYKKYVRMSCEMFSVILTVNVGEE